jgi:hypothetical protein
MEGSTDPKLFLEKLMNNEQARPDLRTQAARDLMRYYHAPADRKASCTLNLPAATDTKTAQGNIVLIRTNFDLGRIGVEEMQARIAAEQAIINSLMDTTLEADFRTIEAVVADGQAPVTVSTTGGLPTLGPPRPADEPQLITPVLPPPPDLGPWAPPESDPESEK